MGEGAGLFVRGGDVSETRVLLDGATVISPFRLDTDRTLSLGRFDPFQLRGIHFSSGGFGAEYGDALSAIVDLQTAARPVANQLGVTASVGGLSGGIEVALAESAGFRLTATHTDTDLLMRLNGRRDEFDQVPASNDLSGGGEWVYRNGGRIRAFALVQTDRVGIRIADPSYSGVFRSEARADLVTVSGLDSFGRIGLDWGVATSGLRSEELFGAFRFDRTERFTQGRTKIRVPVRSGLALTTGADLDYRVADLAGLSPVASHDNAPGAAVTRFASRQRGTRFGGFGEVEVQPSNALRLRAGLRADRSTLTEQTTADPRVSVTWQPTAPLTLTAAWGIFHQIPDPLFFEPVLGIPALPAMRAQHYIGGLSWEEGDRLVRIEAYRKRYAELAAQTRNHVTVGDGSGTASGIDLFARETIALAELDVRMAYSFIRSERTDPDSGRLAPSPFDATHTLHIVIGRNVRSWLNVGLGYRTATGTPFTPVTGAVFDRARDLWQPIYGRPMSERFPRYARLDLSINMLQRFWRDNLTILFVSMMNSLDRNNVRDYRYSADYTRRIPLNTPFPRTIYFGITTNFQ